MNRPPQRQRPRGFTLLELVIVMSMIGLLLSIALPQYMAVLERGRLQAQQSSLATMREAIDKFYGDRGRYPDTLEDLVTQRYLRAIPNDPLTDAPDWLAIAPSEPDKGGVIDVQSAAAERTSHASVRPADGVTPEEPADPITVEQMREVDIDTPESAADVRPAQVQGGER